MTYLSRLVGMDDVKNVLVLGCGPHPQTAKIFAETGANVSAVEPVEQFVALARDYLEAKVNVMQGAAESIPLSTNSQQIVVFEAVLEHVDSIPLSLAEIYRVLAPGGVLYLTTTNRHRFSWKGKNGEYRTPFFNWFPSLVKEGYVFQHLHYRPELANYSSRPAVHWLTYSELCARGRDAGFAQFYSPVDLMRVDDRIIKKSGLRRFVLPLIQKNPWLRAFALTQIGGTIFMLKRSGFSKSTEKPTDAS